MFGKRDLPQPRALAEGLASDFLYACRNSHALYVTVRKPVAPNSFDTIWEHYVPECTEVPDKLACYALISGRAHRGEIPYVLSNIYSAAARDVDSVEPLAVLENRLSDFLQSRWELDMFEMYT